MVQTLVRVHSPEEYFKEQVEAACHRQHLHAHPITSYYLVTLLSHFAHVGSPGAEEPRRGHEALGVKLLRAMDRGGAEQRLGLKQVGDTSLFISGFFADSLRRSLVDVDYYVALGGAAYRLLVANDPTFAPVFAELAEKFVAFVDVVAEVSERSHLSNDADLLRLYEKWVKTGSRRSGDLLAERGILPNASASLRVQ